MASRAVRYGLIAVAFATWLVPVVSGKIPFGGTPAGLTVDEAGDTVRLVVRASTRAWVEVRVRTRDAVTAEAFARAPDGQDSVFVQAAGGPRDWSVRLSGVADRVRDFAWVTGAPVGFRVRGAGGLDARGWTFHGVAGTDTARQSTWRGIWNGFFVALVLLGGIGAAYEAWKKAKESPAKPPDDGLLDLLRPQAQMVATVAVAHVPAHQELELGALKAMLGGATIAEALESVYGDEDDRTRRLRTFTVSVAFQKGLSAALAGEARTGS